MFAPSTDSAVQPFVVTVPSRDHDSPPSTLSHTAPNPAHFPHRREEPANASIRDESSGSKRTFSIIIV